MGEYDGAIATATRLIARKGADVVWRKFTVTDGSEDWNEAGSEHTDFTVKMVILPYNRETASLLAKLANMSDVPVYNMYGLMAPVPFTPVMRDLVISPIFGELRPQRLDILAPGDAIVLYTIGLQA